MKLPAIDLNHHRRLRAILKNHQNRAAKTVPRTAFRKWARTFDLLVGDLLLVETDAELTILFDFLIYHPRQRGRTLAQKYLASLPPTNDPDETLIRHAMANPRYALLKVTASHSFTGVTARDLLRGTTAFVVD